MNKQDSQRQKGNRDVKRRDLLKTSIVAGAPLQLLAGTARAADIPPLQGGYTDQLSYTAGDEVTFHISTTAKTYDLEIARIGAGRDILWRKQDLKGYLHPAPENASTHGCGWPKAVTLRVPENWRSGYYQARLRGIDSGGGEVLATMFFVVRAASKETASRILLQLASNTYNAYNTWGGSSLYGGNPRGRRVSFDRPYAGFSEPFGFTARYSGWARWERHFIRWAERAGYKVDLAVNSDLEFHPEILKYYRLVLSVGHDEYWSSPMRDHLESFIRSGGNAAFFSGNTSFWQVRSEDAGRTLIGWKEAFKQDPVYASGHYKVLSTMWCNRLIARPENHMTGVSFAYGGYHRFFEQYTDGTGGYTIHRPDHWIFQGTGLKRNDLFGAENRIVGYECDGCELEMRGGLPEPTYRDGTPDTFEILGTAPAGLSMVDKTVLLVNVALYGEEQENRPARLGSAVLGIHKRGGTVFTSGCTEWSNGLRGRDPRVDAITRNVLDRLSL
jgi:hypothetical protein